MAKLPKEYQFVDLSDYGRLPARWIANSLKNTPVTPIHLTSLFILSGLIAIFCLLSHQYELAAVFLILKSILDAADGELSRVKNTPSYVGRYYDSIADIILNFLFLLCFWYIGTGPFYVFILAFIGMQLQGTLYNYYYVILRNSVNGDKTSRVFEDSTPIALEGESQKMVNIFYKIYNYLYIIFDKCIYWLDQSATQSRPFPKWFMSMLSSFGLGFQLLLMAILLMCSFVHYILPFFIVYSIFIFLFIGIRRTMLNSDESGKG